MNISVVMPVYNECWTIREIVRRVMAVADSLHEVILVDDGSNDGTREMLPGLVAKYRHHQTPIRIIYKERNEGKGRALQVGFAAVTGDIVIVQDADLEYDPKDYPNLLDPILKGRADVVYGSRFLGGTKNVLLFWHMVANKVLTLCCNLVSNLNLSDVWTGYKVFRTDLIRKISLTARGFGFEPEITVKLAKLGCRICEVPVQYYGRSYAEGKKIGFKDALTGVWVMLRAACCDDLGGGAIGEQTLRIMSRAQRYSRYLYEQYRRYLGREVIEIGAGAGDVSRFLLDRDRLVLTDADQGYLAVLSQIYKGWEYVEVRPLDIARSAPDDLREVFDTAVCFNVLEHVADDRTAVANIAGLLKEGGRAIIMVPAHRWLYGTSDRALGHYRRYEREDFVRLLSGAGFEIEVCDYLNPLAVPGWFLNGRILRRKVIPALQVVFFDRLTFLLKSCTFLRGSFGLSLFIVATKSRGG